MRWEPTRHGGFRRSYRGSSEVERRPNTAEAGDNRKRPPILIFRWRECLGLPECPYLIRWRIETPVGSLRVHHWLGPDDDRAFHDHPWWFLTFLFGGGYADHSPDGVDVLLAPAVRFRPALHRHTVVPGAKGAWTLMLTGPKIRAWGFWLNGTKFVKANKWFLTRGHHPCS